tara:strand:+ start:54 stop:386 length:333 start_codon:yes stop_codon:yes gene_type:complete
MYKITQKKTVKNWFGQTKSIEQIHTFKNSKEALIFALNEQIRYYSHIVDGMHASTRDAYTLHYTLINWLKLAEKNPHHYIGLSSTKGVNLDRLYFYYVNSNNLHRLRKHI